MGSRVVKILVAIEAALILSTLLFLGGAALGLALPRLNPAAGTALGEWLTSPLPSAWTPTPVSPRPPPSPPPPPPPPGAPPRRRLAGDSGRAVSPLLASVGNHARRVRRSAGRRHI